MWAMSRSERMFFHGWLLVSVVAFCFHNNGVWGFGMVELTLISGAVTKGAVCLDGTAPGYHLDRGSGSGADSWLIHLEGGAWCDTTQSCILRSQTALGSSKFMERQLTFAGILSNNSVENPDFFNWNRVVLRYCDGASFSGEGEDQASKLFFRGQRIWLTAMEALMSEGMRNARQALLSGCSAGGLASILHCDKFGALFPAWTRVKCLSDAGFFMDGTDISGKRSMRAFFDGVVRLQGVGKNLPTTCTSRQDPTTCFFPQNLVADIKTPLFLLNPAYDKWQVENVLVPPSSDPEGSWSACKMNPANCSASQTESLQGFRDSMLNTMRGFSSFRKNGLFLNSCFAHCQSDKMDTWFATDSPLIDHKKIAPAVGDWYFYRNAIKHIDCPYPCDGSCHNL